MHHIELPTHVTRLCSGPVNSSSGKLTAAAAALKLVTKGSSTSPPHHDGVRNSHFADHVLHLVQGQLVKRELP